MAFLSVLTCLDAENLWSALSHQHAGGAALIICMPWIVSTRAKITDPHRIRAIQHRLQNAILI